MEHLSSIEGMDFIALLNQSHDPLPISNHVDLTSRCRDGHDWKTLKRLVSAHPRQQEASIETAWEARLQKGDRIESMRIAIYSGPDDPSMCIHASFQLPADALVPVADANVIAWTAFPEHPDHSLLCVLINRTALCIWDVYPDKTKSLLGTEGWTVPLPFECSSIFSLGASGGLLLQRLEDHQDRMLDVPDGFVLEPPPKFGRQGVQDIGVASLPMAQDHSHGVTSLFSLHHPLEEVAPVSQMEPNTFGATFHPVTDVFEEILWVGTCTWADPKVKYLSRCLHGQVLAVSYHRVKKRHAFWLLHDAPPPTAQAPLFQRTRKMLSLRHASIEDWDLLEMRDGAHSAPRVTRDEALAQALGVRRTPRMSLGSAPANRPRHKTTDPGQTSIFTPANRSSATPLDTTTYSDVHSTTTPLVSFNTINPIVALECIYIEKSPTPAAEQVFLASNMDGSGLLTLCLQVPNPVDYHPNTLQLYGLTPLGRNNSAQIAKPILPPVKFSFQVHMLRSIGCRSACPIQALPVPCCFHPHPKFTNNCQHDTTATDILVDFHGDPDEMLLTLCRCTIPLVNFACGPYRTMADPVRSKLSLISPSNRSRITINLQFASALAEKILMAIDAEMFSAAVKCNSPDLMVAALYFRCDCCRLAHLLANNKATLVDADVLATQTIVKEWIRTALGIVQFDNDPGESNFTPWQLVMANKSEGLADELLNILVCSDDQLSNVPTPYSHTVNSQMLKGLRPLSLRFLERKKSLLQSVPLLIDSLHMLYEELSLAPCSLFSSFRELACLLLDIFATIEKCSTGGPTVSPFLDYYSQGFSDMRPFPFGTTPHQTIQVSRFTSMQSPPSAAEWLKDLFEGKSKGANPFHHMSLDDVNGSLMKLRLLLRTMPALFDKSRSKSDVVEILIEEGIRDVNELREEFSIAVLIPYLELFRSIRVEAASFESFNWSPSAWALVGRNDLQANMATKNGMRNFGSILPASNEQAAEAYPTIDGEADTDGLSTLEYSSAMLFPEDNRIHEAARLLRSSRPVFLRVVRSVGVTDHEYERLKQKRLLQLCGRALALSVGRGMLTIGQHCPLPIEPIPIPPLCLKGRVPPANNTLALDISECPSDLKIWPEFHNGVAAGLRLPGNEHELSAELRNSITRTWIAYNRPQRPQVPEANDTGNDSTNVEAQSMNHGHGGFLFALGLRGYLTVLDVSDLYDYLTQGNVTTTVGILLGMAANKRGTCDMCVSKMLCLHIPSLIPHHFSAIDVASSVQTAAVISAGLLYQGSSHRMMTEFLLNEIGKRPDSEANCQDREAYALSCGLALGLVNLCAGQKVGESGKIAGIADLRIEERLYRYIIGGIDDEESRRAQEINDRFSLPVSVDSGDGEKCSTIMENELINTALTAPGATIALGLMYMRTHNVTVASALALPDTHFLLEFVRPDFLTLRVIARALVMWDEVEPTADWIENQIPTVVKHAYELMKNTAKRTATGHLSYRMGTMNLDFDKRAVRQIYVHVIAGACFALGLRFAGTGNAVAKKVLFDKVMELRKLRESTDSASVACRPDIPILDTCLGCVTIALAMVLAGTGDLDALKLFKMLRWRCDDDTRYGSHMVYGMAIGLLFLGGGTCTLGTEPADLAALIVAFYPRFPMFTSDNQYHLQAVRHLYALAVHPKQLRAIDVDTGKNVYVSVEIESDVPSARQIVQVPCLLQNADGAHQTIRIVSGAYYPLQLKLMKGDSGLFYVKRRKAKSEALPLETASGDLLASSEFITEFSRHFANVFARNQVSLYMFGRANEDCCAEDIEEALLFYLALHRGSKSFDRRFLTNLRLLRGFVENTTGCWWNSDSLLPSILEATEQQLASLPFSDQLAKNAATFFT